MVNLLVFWNTTCWGKYQNNKKMTNILRNYKLHLILVLGLLLRILPINQSFWLDEATSGLVVRDLPIIRIIYTFSPSDFHPPLYYLILKIWSIFFGTNEISLRSLSVLAGILSIYVTYLISKELKFKLTWVAPLLLATSGLHIYYSAEARMYSLATLFVSVSFLYFLRIISKKIIFSEWLIFSVFILLSLGTHYLTFLILPVFWLYALCKRLSLGWWKNFLIAQVPLLVGTIAWFPILIQQLGGGLMVNSSSPLWAQVLGKTSLKEIVLVFVKFLVGRVSFENNTIYAFVVLLVLIPTIFVVFKSLLNYKKNLIMILWLFVVLSIGAVIGLFVSVFSYFRFLFILPGFYLLITSGISETSKPRFWVSVFIVINVLTSAYYLLNPKFHREDWRSLVGFIEANRIKDSQVLFVANSQMEGYKYYSKDAKILGPDSFSNKSDEVWLVRYVKDIFDPSDNLKSKVENAGFTKTNEYNFNGIPVLKYENRN